LGSGGFSDFGRSIRSPEVLKDSFIIWQSIPRKRRTYGWIGSEVVAHLTALLKKYKAEGHSRPV
jgi:hypothetical protein